MNEKTNHRESDEGQGFAEYELILLGVALVLAVSAYEFGGALYEIYEQIAAQF